MLTHAIFKRLERAEARNVLECARSRAKLHGFTAEYRWIAGGYAIYAGHWTHLTQAVATGVSGPVGIRDVERLSSYFVRRLAIPTVHVADVLPSVVHMLTRRGFRRIGELNVMARRVNRRIWNEVGPGAGVMIAHGSTMRNEWVRAMCAGFTGVEKPDDLEIGKVVNAIPQSVPFCVSDDGERVRATGALAVYSGVAILFGDATRSRERGMGLQRSLIDARVRFAAASGCDVATAIVVGGSASERNYRRAGFRRVYGRVVLQQE